MVSAQGQIRVIAFGSILLAFVLSACSAGIVAVSKDSLVIYERAGDRLKKNHEVMEEVVRGLRITDKASRRNQLRWESAVEIAKLEHQYGDLLTSASSEEDKKSLRKEAILRIAAIREDYRERIDAVDREVDAETDQLLGSHQMLMKLNGELLKNQEEIHRCLEISVSEALKKMASLDFSTAKSQCFVDIGQIKRLIEEGRGLLNELKKIREKNEKGQKLASDK